MPIRKDLHAQLAREIAQARTATDALFDLLEPQALYERPIAERHRIIFYLGHLDAFDWNLMARGAFDISAFNPDFDRLFEFGIDPLDGGLPADQPADWPRVAEIRAYTQRAREHIDRALLSAVDRPSTNLDIFHVAIEHRWMHAETLAYMLHWLEHDKKRPPPRSSTRAPRYDRAQQPAEVRIPAGDALLGQAPGAFGWDNEFAAHRQFVPAFTLDVHNVTNGDFLEFVRAGGYGERSLWSDADWDWMRASGLSHPKFWRRAGDTWLYRTMFEEIPLPLDWPVYVSHAEASAYARWRGKSLPTEAQFQRAAFGTPGDPDALAVLKNGNHSFRSWTPEPVGAAGCVSAFGVHDLVGNGWEWTSTVFAPFEGFAPAPFYPGYSANFFDGRHFVMKGASPRTASALIRPSFRNWFQPHYSNVYATFRCAQ
jgi:gamma-glutamyl hercynylcysteine S-oxide synthase